MDSIPDEWSNRCKGGGGRRELRKCAGFGELGQSIRA